MDRDGRAEEEEQADANEHVERCVIRYDWL